MSGHRIGDAERERAMAELGRHYAEGRLDHDEYDERLDAIGTARTAADLVVLFEDLPAPVNPKLSPAGRTSRAPVRRRRRLPAPLLVLLVLAVAAVALGKPWLFLVGLGVLLLVGRSSCSRHQGPRVRQAR